MRFFAIGMLVMILAVFTSPASAQVTTYDCSINSLEGRGFIRDRVIFSVDPTQKVAGVVDDFVMLVYKTPIPADLTILNNGQYRLKWSVDNLRSGADTFVFVSCGRAGQLTVRVNGGTELKPGDPVGLAFEAAHMHRFDVQGLAI